MNHKRDIPARPVALLVLCMLLLAGCNRGRTATQEQTATPTAATGTSISANPSAMPSPTPLFTLTPATPIWESIDLGIPQGNAHSPQSVAISAATGQIFVLSGQSALGSMTANSPVLTVVDGATGEILRTTKLTFFSGPISGQLMLTADASQALLLNRDDSRLYAYDLATGAVELLLSDAWAVLVSPDGTRLAVQQPERVAVYSADLQTLLWEEASGGAGAELAMGDDSLLIVTRPDPDGSRLASYRLQDGTPGAQTNLDGWLDRLSGGLDGGWFLSISGETPFLLALDADLEETARRNGYRAAAFALDSANRSLIATLEQRDKAGQPQYSLARLSPALTFDAQQPWPDWRLPDSFAFPLGSAPVLADTIPAVRRFDDGDRLYLLDRKTLAVRQRVPLGVRIRDILVDNQRDLLLVADNQDQILTIGLTSGQIAARWQGTLPWALDRDNGRLYVNRRAEDTIHVAGLDLDDGTSLADFPLAGVPASDPQRDIVYIVDRGIFVFSRDGTPLGRLQSSFPTDDPFVPNPSTYRVAVNPISGSLIAFKNNGVPGSNNRNFAVAYPPPAVGSTLPADEPIDIPNLDSVLTTVAFDPATGSGYLAYGSFRGISGLQRLADSGTWQQTVHGRTGQLAFDSVAQAGQLLVVREDVVARFSPDLTFIGEWLAQASLDLAVFDPVGSRFFYQEAGQGPILRHVAVADLQKLEPQAGAPQNVLPFAQIDRLYPLMQPDGRTLLFVDGSGPHLAFSEDHGQTWRLIQFQALTPTARFVSVDGAGTLYFVSASSNGVGVYRSADGGESWQLLAAGLTDLRGVEPVQFGPENRAFLSTPSGQVVTWEEETERWRSIPLPDQKSFLGQDEFLVAPNGALFLRDFLQASVSTDLGQTWQSLPEPDESVQQWIFASDFASSRQIFGLQGFDAPVFVRSDDGGESWQPPQPGFSLAPGDEYRFYTLAQAESTLYIAESSSDGIARLFRSIDRGDNWQALVDPSNLASVRTFAIDPHDVLWVAHAQADGATVSTTDLKSTEWSAFPPAETPPPTATPAPTATPIPTALPPCTPELDPERAQIQQQVPALVCPTTDRSQVYVARQTFQQGRMFWRSDTRTILVLANDGTWQAFADAWDESQPEADEAIQPPPDLLQPIRGFGKIWREQLGAADAAIGWATSPEQGLDAGIQTWQGGTVISFDLADRTILLNDGTWQVVK